MIAASILILAGIISAQNVHVLDDRVDGAEFVFFTIVCWTLALLCAIGVINQ